MKCKLRGIKLECAANCGVLYPRGIHQTGYRFSPALGSLRARTKRAATMNPESLAEGLTGQRLELYNQVTGKFWRSAWRRRCFCGSFIIWGGIL